MIATDGILLRGYYFVPENMKTVIPNHKVDEPIDPESSFPLKKQDAPSLRPNSKYASWGKYPASTPRKVIPFHWQDDKLPLDKAEGTVLPYGLGRSYGDSCLNNNNTLIDIKPLNRFIQFDEIAGVIRCEAGVSLADIHKITVPRGWFVSVTPGTKFVTVGGAIANDVHGKNHHRKGTFGCHVTQLELLRSDGNRYLCSPTENSALFSATIGGLGLTGVITWAEFRLQSIPGPNINQELIRFDSLDEFFDLSEASNALYPYVVSWVDCSATGKHLGRGIFTRGDWAWQKQGPGLDLLSKLEPTVPLDFPSATVNKYFVHAFNFAYYHRLMAKQKRGVVHYETFFYPLDGIHHWNRGFGKAGFLQYQCLVPFSDNRRAIRKLLEIVAESEAGTFINVLKTCGDIPSPGMLSFPRPGVTLALDMRFQGEETLRLCDRLDAITRDAGGAVYPAKDARMSPESFQTYYPRWQEFSQYIDPQFSSSFWRRVTQR